MKILICEDNKIMLDIIHKAVANYTMIHDWDNVTIFPTNNATETLEVINSEKIDFFFLDIDLGNNEINGIELGRKIRDNELKRVPYMIIVGEKEAADGLGSMRKQGGGEQATMSKQEFVDIINAEVEEMLEATNIQPQS